MEKIYENALEMIKRDGSTGFIAFGKYIFGIKYEDGNLTFGNVYDYQDFKIGITSTILVRTRTVAVTEETLNASFDTIVEKFIEKYLYEPGRV